MNEHEMGGDIAALTAALVKAQGAIEPAPKDRQNPHFGQMYATLASVWGAIRVPLAANGLAVVQMPRTDGTLVSVRTLLLHTGGGWLMSECSANARDAGPQAVGSVITYCRRYGLAAMVGVVADDDDDANEGQAKPAKAKPASKSSAKDDERCTADQASLIDKIVRSHVITDDERAPILDKISRGTMSKLRAVDCIDWLTKEIRARKEQAKRARDDADDADSREPGSDDT